MGIVFTEGLPYQIGQLFNFTTTPNDTLGFAATGDSIAYSDSTTYGDVSPWVGGRGPLAYDPTFPASFVTADGQSTVSFNPQQISLTAGGTTVTLTQWVMYSWSDSVLLWGGTVSPPLTLSSSGSTSAELEGITLTLGQCTPAGASDLLLLDLFLGETTVGIGSHSPLVGPVFEVLGGGIAVGQGSAQPTTAGADYGVWDLGATDYSITLSGVCLFPDDLLISFRWQDALNYYRAGVEAGSNAVVEAFSGGVETVLWTTPYTPLPGQIFSISLLLVGGDATVMVGSSASTTLTGLTGQSTSTLAGMLLTLTGSDTLTFFTSAIAASPP